MKKVFVTLSVILLTAVSAFAGGGKGTTRYYAPKFTQGWFIDGAGTYSILMGSGCNYLNPTTYYGWGGTQFGFSAKLGRRVGNSTALRLGYDWHPATNEIGDFTFTSIHFDVMESPMDLFLGYNPKRFFTIWLYGGLGLLSRSPADSFTFYWNSLEFGGHVGIMNNFRISNSLDFHIDLTGVLTRWSYDSDVFDGVNSWHRMHIDWTAMAGLMWYLGGRSLTVVEGCPEVDCSEQDARIEELESEILKLNKQLASCGGEVVPCDTIWKETEITKVISYPYSIFFNKGSYEFRDGRDLINLNALGTVAADNNLKVTLTGTCDSATGSAAFNNTLAENRCNKVKAELITIGVPESNITINPRGGVDNLKPAEYDRRVIIELSK